MRRFGLAAAAALVACPAAGRAAEPGPAPRLCGIVVSGDARMAVFELAPGTTVAAGEGEAVGPYRVRGIMGEAVRVQQDGRDLVLALSGSDRTAEVVDTGGVTFGLVVNPQRPPDD